MRNLLLRFLRVSVVKFGVIGSRENQQVRRPIIRLNPVLVVDDLKALEVSTYHSLGHKSMLSHISHAICMGMVWAKLRNVISLAFSARFFPYPSFPSRMLGAMSKLSGVGALANPYSGLGKLYASVSLPNRAHSLLQFRGRIQATSGAILSFFKMTWFYLKHLVTRRAMFIQLVLLISVFNYTPLFAESQWTKGDPQGTEASGTIDNIIRINNEATDRLLIGYKRGLGVNYVNANALSVLAGELAIPNSAGSITRWRRNTTATSVTWSDLDTGAEESDNDYTLFAVADTDATTMTFKISASTTAPSGATYYRKIATFDNVGGSITNLKSLRPDDGTDYPDVIEGWINFDGTGTVAINDQYNVSSLTDNGTGDYTIAWTTAFANAYYAVAGSANLDSAGSPRDLTARTIGTTSVRVYTGNSNVGLEDCDTVTMIAAGDRA